MSLASKRVLLIDDDSSFRLVVRKILEAQGMEFHEAPDLTSARQMLVTLVPDIIILDLNLEAGERGQTFLLERQDNTAWKKIPVVVCSADAQAEVVRECVLHGADDFLLKPIKQSWLIQRLHKHLLQQKMAVKRFGAAEAPALTLEWSAQIVGLGETRCVIRSQAKFLREARAEIASELFNENEIFAKHLRCDTDGRSTASGVYDNTFTILGVTEKEASKIRQLKTSWGGR